MSGRPALYVAGPYRGDVVTNVQRASRLGTFGVDCGYTPYVPHALGFLGIFGAGTGGDDAHTEPRAIDACLTMIGHLGPLEGSRLWVITRDDGSLSSGTAAEVEAWLPYGDPIARTWAQWLKAFAGGPGAWRDV